MRTTCQNKNRSRITPNIIGKAGVILKLKKFTFPKNQIFIFVRWLTRSISKSRPHHGHYWWPQTPTTKTKFFVFIVSCNIFRFVRNFAWIALQITAVIPERYQRVTGKRNKEELTNMRTLSLKLIISPILVLLRRGNSYTIDKDAYDQNLRYVLL